MSDVLVMPMPEPDLRTRLTAQIEYAQTHLSLVVAHEDVGMRALKSIRNQLSSLRCRCNGFTPDQTEPVRIAALEAIGHLTMLDRQERIGGKMYLPHVRKALELLVQTMTDRPTPPASEQRAA